MSDTLPLKYRPKYLDEMVGNKAAISMVEKYLEREISKIPSAWLLTGPSGTGKTTMARILKEELECDDLGFMEYNASNTRGIDTIRQIQDSCRIPPMKGSTKVYLIDECHMLTSEAQNGALKMLEDSPPGVFFMLATTNPEKLIPTLVKRCAAIKLETVSPTVIMTLLQEVVEAEEKTIPSAILSAISKNCEGTPRDALRILDAVIDMEDEKEMLYCIQEGIPENESLFDFCKMLLDKKVKWNEIASWLKENKAEPESTRRGVLGILNAFLLKDGNNTTAAVMECFENNYYDSGKAGLTLSCLAAKNI